MALKELYHGRVQTQSGRVEYIRVFECPSSEVQEAGGGWTGNGITLPAYGDLYPYGTWSGEIQPSAGLIDVDGRSLVGIARITARYWAPLSRARA